MGSASNKIPICMKTGFQTLFSCGYPIGLAGSPRVGSPIAGSPRVGFPIAGLKDINSLAENDQSIVRQQLLPDSVSFVRELTPVKYIGCSVSPFSYTSIAVLRSVGRSFTTSLVRQSVIYDSTDIQQENPETRQPRSLRVSSLKTKPRQD